MAQKRDEKPALGGSAAGAAEYAGHGLTLAGSTLLFLWLALLGAFVGAGAGFYHMYHQLVVVPRERDERKAR